MASCIEFGPSEPIDDEPYVYPEFNLDTIESSPRNPYGFPTMETEDGQVILLPKPGPCII